MFNKTFSGKVFQYFKYSNNAYVWSNESWSLIPTENPCSNEGQNLAFQQPCTKRFMSNQTEMVIITFGNKNPCTSILNLDSYEWSKVNITQDDIPTGGHLVTSIDKKCVFYLGGLYYEPQERQSFDVYELSDAGWQLTEAKVPFGISSNETKSYASLHNVTLN